MPVARRNDPETSWWAAYDATYKADSDRGAVYRCLLAHPEGMTDFELAEQTGLGDNARKRRSDLKNAGLVVDTGYRKLAPSGSWAIVWGVTEPPKPLEPVPEDTETVEVQGSLL